MLTLRPDDPIGNSLTAFIKDVGKQFQVSMQNQRRDSRTLLKRYESEGVGFVTKTLPKFGKHFDTCLKNGRYVPNSTFRRGNGTVLPAFLLGLTNKVFDAQGTLLCKPDCDAIRLIRQLVFMYYKLDVPYRPETESEAIVTFEETDKSLTACDLLQVEDMGAIDLASNFISDLFKDFDHGDISPRPGPGASADNKQSWLRYEPHVLYTKIHERYPYYRYYYCNSKHLLDSLRKYKSLPRQTDGISKLSLVPKDSRGPRIICAEPTEFMWLQQGLGRAMMDWIERHPLTSGHVNFYDQTVNGKLALSSSKSREFSTLDMKEASDRISTNLVELLFDGVPQLRDALLALSTGNIELPDGRIMKKKKYAPMGSALCFPVMSIVHYALGVASICLQHGVNRKISRQALYVYGDDLVVKTEYAGALLDVFPRYDLLFNSGKCCIEGHFRESCGIDAYDGVDVTPQRIRNDAILKNQPKTIVSSVAMVNGFFQRGLWTLAATWRRRIEQAIGLLPCATAQSKVIGWTVPRNQVFLANKDQWRRSKSDDYQSDELKARIIVPRPFASMSGGWEQLVKSQLHSTVDSSPVQIRDHIRIKWSRVPLSGV